MSRDSFKVADRLVGKCAPSFIIAEIAQAHDGSLGFAHSYIDLAKRCGADAIKFQTHIADAETTPLEEFRVRFSYEDKTRFDYWKRMEFTSEQWAGLAEHARDSGLIFLSTPFSLEALELLEKLAVPAWKVGSGELKNTPLLTAMANTQKPILLSSGLSTWNDLDSSVALLNQKKATFGIFQCTTKYPTAFEDVGLNVLDELRDRYECAVGLSDHSGSPFPSLAAIARGADMIEVHLAFDRMQFGPDTVASLLPDQLSLVAAGRDAFYKMSQNPVDKNTMSASLSDVANLFGKSVTLKVAQVKGTTLTRDMLTSKKPGTGIPVEKIESLVGRTLKRNVSSQELLSESDLV